MRARLQNTKVGICHEFNLHFPKIPMTSDFINTSIGKLSEADRTKRWPGWVTNFTKACGTEKAFFDLGIPSSTNKVPAYKVVKDGTYKIRNYENNHFLISKTDNSVITKSLRPKEGLSSSWSALFLKHYRKRFWDSERLPPCFRRRPDSTNHHHDNHSRVSKLEYTVPTVTKALQSNEGLVRDRPFFSRSQSC